MVAKDKYQRELFGESPAEDVFEHRKLIFDMANEAVENEKNPLYKFARRAAAILDANPDGVLVRKKSFSIDYRSMPNSLMTGRKKKVARTRSNN